MKMANKKLLNVELFQDAMPSHVLAVVNGYPAPCSSDNCMNCMFRKDERSCLHGFAEWLLAEADDNHLVDWSTVEVDTPILVRDKNETGWYKRHFAKYEDGKIYVYMNGGTSWTSGPNQITPKYYAKMPDDNLLFVEAEKLRGTLKGDRRSV